MNYRQVGVYFFSPFLWHAKYSSSSSTLKKMLYILELFVMLSLFASLYILRVLYSIIFTSIVFTKCVLRVSFSLFFLLEI